MKHQRQNVKMAISTTDIDERFIVKKCTIYLCRHLNRYFSTNRNTIRMICWTLGQDMEQISEYLLCQLDKNQKDMFLTELSESDTNHEDYADACFTTIRKAGPKLTRQFNHYILQLFKQRINSLEKQKTSDIEKNISSLKRMFNLSDQEIEFCVLMFIVTTCDEAESFFWDHLKCNKFLGFKYLTNILQITKNELDKILTGTIDKIGMIDFDNFSMKIENDFIDLFQNPSKQTFSDKFYTKIPRSNISIQNYFMSDNQINHIMHLLKERSETSTHILFYGPPGTGKTSFVFGLTKFLGLPAYEIVRVNENTTMDRRASILACLNMTNPGKGAIILVDEADNILNTKLSWFARGETQDKGWLNQLLEKPGARMIWVTNSIDNIEDSVLRRFAYSVYFKPFNRLQRIQLWENVLSQNKCKRFFSKSDIDLMAKRFNVSAGVIDLSVKKAIETNPKSKRDFHSSITMALNAHLALLNSGNEPANKEIIEKNYSLDGLNINGDLDVMIKQLEKFDQFLRESNHDKILNMNLLFYGPPGTGKSELARYIATHLDREIICKRVSDIQNMYVGETEKNIKKAFQEAESDEAVLIFDEAESLLFTRDRAQRSWEISFTNEFLTQMEKFRGILICTTNRSMDLDEASVRRFNHKIEFNYLTGDGNIIFYEKLLLNLAKMPLNDSIKNALKRIDNLAPGDFKTVRDRFAFYSPKDVNHQILVNALAEEALIKDIHSGNTRIGF